MKVFLLAMMCLGIISCGTLKENLTNCYQDNYALTQENAELKSNARRYQKLLDDYILEIIVLESNLRECEHKTDTLNYE